MLNSKVSLVVVRIEVGGVESLLASLVAVVRGINCKGHS